MPQFFAVRCYSCKMHQVQQSTKTRKWLCRLCHSKQSIQQVFASSSSAADVRHVVQQLNLRLADTELKLIDNALETESLGMQKPNLNIENSEANENSGGKMCKWAKYLDAMNTPEEIKPSDDLCDGSMPDDSNITKGIVSRRWNERLQCPEMARKSFNIKNSSLCHTLPHGTAYEANLFRESTNTDMEVMGTMDQFVNPRWHSYL